MQYETWYDRREQEVIEGLFTYLRSQSVSADPKRKGEVLACAEWVKNQLHNLGCKTRFLKGSGYPAIYAEKIVDNAFPTVLFYGHYDVQHEDPYELWTSPPFEPTIREGRIYARGAHDDKGQTYYLIRAVQAFLEMNEKVRVNIKFLIEGEEEMGSTTVEEVAPKNAALLAADYLLIVDSSIDSFKEPRITVGYKGISTMQVDLRVMRRDGHSGEYGGIAYNPLRALAEALAKIYDERGRITIDRFYDKVRTLSEEEKALLSFQFDPKKYKEEMGLEVFFPDEELTPKEVNGLLPVIEINGLWGGYTGEGFKTVLPGVAHAKISCRIVPDQEPREVFKQISRFLRAHLPKGMQPDITYLGGGRGLWTSPTSKVSIRVKEAYEKVIKKPVRFEVHGASIPIAHLLAGVTKAEVAFVGVGLSVDAIHAPDESFSLYQLRTGFLMIAAFLQALQEE